MPRDSHYRAIDATRIPSSTSECLIFAYDKTNRRFKIENYSSTMTQGRATYEEIEAIIKEINIPTAAWYDEHGKFYEKMEKYCCMIFLFLFFFPLLFCYLCWLASKKSRAEKELEQLRQKVRTIIRARGAPFVEKGLVWTVTPRFPDWIELIVKPNIHQQAQGPIQFVVIHQQPQPNYQVVGMAMPQQQPEYSVVGNMGNVGSVGMQNYQQQPEHLAMGMIGVQNQQPEIQMMSYQESGYPAPGIEYAPVQENPVVIEQPQVMHNNSLEHAKDPR